VKRAGKVAHHSGLFAALLGLFVTQAFAAPAWTVKGRGTDVHLEITSLAPGSRLVLGCEDVPKLYLYIPRGWDGAKLETMFLAIDGVQIPITADGADRAVILSDRPKEAVGVTRSLLSRMRRGKQLIVSGSATTKIPPGQLTFPLTGAAPAITAFERQCPAMRRA
jgi:hypothetical protein